jgi:hypothetical protein
LPLDNVIPEVISFVDRYIDSFVTWDVLAYFHENPGIERKLSGISVDVGRKVSSLEPVLESLAEHGVLESETDPGEEPSYRYTPTSGFGFEMDRFLEATRDRTNRLAIVSRVLQKEARRL